MSRLSNADWWSEWRTSPGGIAIGGGGVVMVVGGACLAAKTAAAAIATAKATAAAAAAAKGAVVAGPVLASKAAIVGSALLASPAGPVLVIAGAFVIIGGVIYALNDSNHSLEECYVIKQAKPGLEKTSKETSIQLNPQETKKALEAAFKQIKKSHIPSKGVKTFYDKIKEGIEGKSNQKVNSKTQQKDLKLEGDQEVISEDLLKSPHSSFKLSKKLLSENLRRFLLELEFYTLQAFMKSEYFPAYLDTMGYDELDSSVSSINKAFKKVAKSFSVFQKIVGKVESYIIERGSLRTREQLREFFSADRSWTASKIGVKRDYFLSMYQNLSKWRQECLALYQFNLLAWERLRRIVDQQLKNWSSSKDKVEEVKKHCRDTIKLLYLRDKKASEKNNIMTGFNIMLTRDEGSEYLDLSESFLLVDLLRNDLAKKLIERHSKKHEDMPSQQLKEKEKDD